MSEGMLSSLGAVAWLFVAGASHAAETWPTKSIRFVCPYVAGGAADIFSRNIGQKLTEALGQTVVVDNRPGANGGIGTELVAKSLPDGYALLMGNAGPMTVNPVLYHKVPYDPVKDFAPVTQGTSYRYVLVVQQSTAVANTKDLIALLKAKPGQLTYGSTGVGGGNHLAGELFNPQADRRRTPLMAFILDASVAVAASRYDVTAYDASYLALAIELKLPVACSDSGLKAALSRAGVKLA